MGGMEQVLSVTLSQRVADVTPVWNGYRAAFAIGLRMS
jgi:hypothetical protein